MSGLLLTPADRAHLLRMMRRQTPSPVHRRMNALLLDDGWGAEQIANALFMDAETVREHRRLYQASGVAGLDRLNDQGAASTSTRNSLRRWERNATHLFI